MNDLNYFVGVSWPRSGHHLLVRILRQYFKNRFSYCEFYGSANCCKKIPCSYAGYINFSKNHDYKSIVPILEKHNYLIQYREFIPSVISDYELYCCTDEDNKQNFQNFSIDSLKKYKLFISKWSRANSKQSYLYYLSYEKLTLQPKKEIRKIISCFVPSETVNEKKLSNIINQAKFISIENGKRSSKDKVGILNQRNIKNFRYFDSELFDELESESSAYYKKICCISDERSNNAPFENAIKSAYKDSISGNDTSKFIVDVTGPIVEKKVSEISRIERFIVAKAINKHESEVKVIRFDKKINRYRHLTTLEFHELREKLNLKPKQIEPSKIIANTISSNGVEPIEYSIKFDRNPILLSNVMAFGALFQPQFVGIRSPVLNCYDLNQHLNPEFENGEGEPDRFVDQLQIFTRHGSYALCTSETARQTLVDFVDGIGTNQMDIYQFPMPSILYDKSLANQSEVSTLPAEPYVFYCSTIKANKNHIFLARLWKRAIDEGIKFPKLICAGKWGNGVDELKGFLQQNPELNSQIEFTGFVEDDVLINLYRGALFGVMPSRIEGWAFGASECLDFGTPVIVSTAPSLKEATSGLMPMIDPDDDDAWFSQIRSWSENPEKLDQHRELIYKKYRPVLGLESWREIKKAMYIIALKNSILSHNHFVFLDKDWKLSKTRDFNKHTYCLVSELGKQDMKLDDFTGFILKKCKNPVLVSDLFRKAVIKYPTSQSSIEVKVENVLIEMRQKGIVDWQKDLCTDELYGIVYVPNHGTKSPKAERLVEFCLGHYSEKDVIRCTEDKNYLHSAPVSLVTADEKQIRLTGLLNKRLLDQKQILKALTNQHAKIPNSLRCWLITGDGAGARTDAAQGLHIGGMRHKSNSHVVLVPTSNRNRFLGPNLTKSMTKIQKSWIPWENKYNSAWWGGDLTGDRWRKNNPPILSRRDVLTHFRDAPSEHVALHLSRQVPSSGTPIVKGAQVKGMFEHREAFAHKCLILLPGNDIASGSSWYFASNSVVLMPKPHLDHILYFELTPWEHYIPLENDPSDILTKLNWVLDNEKEAQEIVRNAHNRLRWLCGPEYLWACNEVLRRITL